MSNKWCIQTRA